jgi:hypothetical protein
MASTQTVIKSLFQESSTGPSNLCAGLSLAVQGDIVRAFNKAFVIDQTFTDDEYNAFVEWSKHNNVYVRGASSDTTSHRFERVCTNYLVHMIHNRIRSRTLVLIIASTFKEAIEFAGKHTTTSFRFAIRNIGPKASQRLNDGFVMANSIDPADPLYPLACEFLNLKKTKVTPHFLLYDHLNEIPTFSYDMIVCIDGLLDFPPIDWQALMVRTKANLLSTMHYCPELITVKKRTDIPNQYFAYHWEKRNSKYYVMVLDDGSFDYIHKKSTCIQWWSSNVIGRLAVDPVFENGGYGLFNISYLPEECSLATKRLRSLRGVYRLFQVLPFLQYGKIIPLFVDSEHYDNTQEYTFQFSVGKGDWDPSKIALHIRGNKGNYQILNKLISGKWKMFGERFVDLVLFVLLEVSLENLHAGKTMKEISSLIKNAGVISWFTQHVAWPFKSFVNSLKVFFRGPDILTKIRAYKIMDVNSDVEMMSALHDIKSTIRVYKWSLYDFVLVGGDSPSQLEDYKANVLGYDRRNVETLSHAAAKLSTWKLFPKSVVLHWGAEPGGMIGPLSERSKLLIVARPKAHFVPILRSLTALAPDPDKDKGFRLKYHMFSEPIKIEMNKKAYEHRNVVFEQCEDIFETLDLKWDILFCDISCCNGYCCDSGGTPCGNPFHWLRFLCDYVSNRGRKVVIKVNTPNLRELAKLFAMNPYLRIRVYDKPFHNNPMTFERYWLIKRRLIPSFLTEAEWFKIINKEFAVELLHWKNYQSYSEEWEGVKPEPADPSDPMLEEDPEMPPDAPDDDEEIPLTRRASLPEEPTLPHIVPDETVSVPLLYDGGPDLLHLEGVETQRKPIEFAQIPKKLPAAVPKVTESFGINADRSHEINLLERRDKSPRRLKKALEKNWGIKSGEWQKLSVKTEALLLHFAGKLYPCSILPDGKCVFRAISAIEKGFQEAWSDYVALYPGFAPEKRIMPNYSETIKIFNQIGVPYYDFVNNKLYLGRRTFEFFGIILLFMDHCDVALAEEGNSKFRIHKYVRRPIPIRSSMFQFIPFDAQKHLDWEWPVIYQAVDETLDCDEVVKYANVHKKAKACLQKIAKNNLPVEPIKIAFFNGVPGAGKTEIALEFVKNEYMNKGRTLFFGSSRKAKDDFIDRYLDYIGAQKGKVPTMPVFGVSGKTHGAMLCTSTGDQLVVLPNLDITLIIIDECFRHTVFMLLYLARIYPRARFLLLGDPLQMSVDPATYYHPYMRTENCPLVTIYDALNFTNKEQPGCIKSNVSHRFGPRICHVARKVQPTSEICCSTLKEGFIEDVSSTPIVNYLHSAHDCVAMYTTKEDPELVSDIKEAAFTAAAAQGLTKETALILLTPHTGMAMTNYSNTSYVMVTRGSKYLRIWKTSSYKVNPDLKLERILTFNDFQVTVGGEFKTSKTHYRMVSVPNPSGERDTDFIREMMFDKPVPVIPTVKLHDYYPKIKPRRVPKFSLVDFDILGMLPRGNIKEHVLMPIIESKAKVRPSALLPMQKQIEVVSETFHGMRHESKSVHQAITTATFRQRVGHMLAKKHAINRISLMNLQKYLMEDLIDKQKYEMIMDRNVFEVIEATAVNDFLEVMKMDDRQYDLTVRKFLNRSSYFLKKQIKPKTVESTFQVKGGQPVVSKEKAINVKFSPIFRAALEIFKKILIDKVILATGKTPETLAKEWGDKSAFAKWLLELDFVNYDAMFTDEVRTVEFLCWCFITPDAKQLGLYFSMTKNGLVVSDFMIYVSITKGSGEPNTWSGNTIILLVIICWVGRSKLGKGWIEFVLVIIVGGDDSSIATTISPDEIFDFTAADPILYDKIKINKTDCGVTEFSNWLMAGGFCVYNPITALKKINNKNYSEVLKTQVNWDEWMDAWQTLQYMPRVNYVECMKLVQYRFNFSEGFADRLLTIIESYSQLTYYQAKRILKTEVIIIEDFVGGLVKEIEPTVRYSLLPTMSISEFPKFVAHDISSIPLEAGIQYLSSKPAPTKKGSPWKISGLNGTRRYASSKNGEFLFTFDTALTKVVNGVTVYEVFVKEREGLTIPKVNVSDVKLDKPMSFGEMKKIGVAQWFCCKCDTHNITDDPICSECATDVSNHVTKTLRPCEGDFVLVFGLTDPRENPVNACLEYIAQNEDVCSKPEVTITGDPIGHAPMFKGVLKAVFKGQTLILQSIGNSKLSARRALFTKLAERLGLLNSPTQAKVVDSIVLASLANVAKFSEMPKCHWICCECDELNVSVEICKGCGNNVSDHTAVAFVKNPDFPRSGPFYVPRFGRKAETAVQALPQRPRRARRERPVVVEEKATVVVRPTKKQKNKAQKIAQGKVTRQMKVQAQTAAKSSTKIDLAETIVAIANPIEAPEVRLASEWSTTKTTPYRSKQVISVPFTASGTRPSTGYQYMPPEEQMAFVRRDPLHAFTYYDPNYASNTFQYAILGTSANSIRGGAPPGNSWLLGMSAEAQMNRIYLHTPYAVNYNVSSYRPFGQYWYAYRLGQQPGRFFWMQKGWNATLGVSVDGNTNSGAGWRFGCDFWEPDTGLTQSSLGYHMIDGNGEGSGYITANYTGYYSFFVEPNEGVAGNYTSFEVLSLSIDNTTSHDGDASGGVWCTIPLNSLNNNITSFTGLKTIGTSIMFSNTDAKLYIGGKIAQIQVPQGHNWMEFIYSEVSGPNDVTPSSSFGYGAIAAMVDTDTRRAERGSYMFMKPTKVEDFAWRSDYVVDGGNIMDCTSPLESEDSFLAWTFSGASTSQDGYFTLAFCGEAITTDVSRTTAVAKGDPLAILELMRGIRPMKQYFDNPAHLKDLFMQAKKGLAMVTKVGDNIGKSGRALTDIWQDFF